MVGEKILEDINVFNKRAFKGYKISGVLKDRELRAGSLKGRLERRREIGWPIWVWSGTTL